MDDSKQKDAKTKIWENVQLLCLALTIAGQVVIGPCYLAGQGLWLVSNVLAIIRNFVLVRPMADKVKDAAMTAITAGLMIAYAIMNI